MSIEETGDLPVTEPVAQDLDSIIGQAYDNAVPDEAPVEGETATETAERPRDERGRFAPKTPAPEASEEGATEGADEPTTEAVAEPAQVQPIEPPARWSEADKAKFAALPREAQEIVLERVKATDADYTRKTQEIADVRKQAEPLLQAIQPHRDYLSARSAQIGLPTEGLVGRLITFEQALNAGPSGTQAAVLQDIGASYVANRSTEDRIAAVAAFAHGAGIDLRALANGEVAQPDPVINQLRQTVSTLTHELNQIKSATEAEQTRQVTSTIETFATATDANGQPKHPHFEVVKAAMGQLIANGEVSTLEEAYALAAKPIEDRIAAALSAKAQEAEKHRQEALAKAKKVAPVRSTGSQPNGMAKSTDLDSILAQSIASAGIG
jgi:hypothetical protein